MLRYCYSHNALADDVFFRVMTWFLLCGGEADTARRVPTASVYIFAYIIKNTLLIIPETIAFVNSFETIP